MAFESGCKEYLGADPVPLDNVVLDAAIKVLLTVFEHDDQGGSQPLLLLHADAGLIDLPNPFIVITVDHLDAGLFG